MMNDMCGIENITPRWGLVAGWILDGLPRPAALAIYAAPLGLVRGRPSRPLATPPKMRGIEGVACLGIGFCVFIGECRCFFDGDTQ